MNYEQISLQVTSFYKEKYNLKQLKKYILQKVKIKLKYLDLCSFSNISETCSEFMWWTCDLIYLLKITAHHQLLKLNGI